MCPQDKDQRSLDMDTAKSMLALLLGRTWPLFPVFHQFLEVKPFCSRLFGLAGEKSSSSHSPHCFPLLLSLPQQSKYKGMNKDQWYNVLEFSRTINTDLCNYDEDGACKFNNCSFTASTFPHFVQISSVDVDPHSYL